MFGQVVWLGVEDAHEGAKHPIGDPICNGIRDLPELGIPMVSNAVLGNLLTVNLSLSEDYQFE